MPILLARDAPKALRTGGGDRLARVEMRRQIGRLERELAGLAAEAFPLRAIETNVAAAAGPPRVAGLEELERVRDALAERIGEARRALAGQAELWDRNRELLRAMRADPAAHKWVRVSRADIGEHGCGHWHSLPRLGPLGMLMGWWRVKVSSGCPLIGRLAAVEREAHR
jgi:hypothetical protein